MIMLGFAKQAVGNKKGRPVFSGRPYLCGVIHYNFNCVQVEVSDNDA